METEFQNIIEKFLILNRRGYIPSISHNLINAAGLTLENCLGKKQIKRKSKGHNRQSGSPL